MVNKEELAVLKKQLKREQRDIKIHKFTKNKLAMVGAIITFLMIFFAIFAPFLAPQGPLNMTVADRLQAPSMHHIFGTDTFGRDLFARVIYGARVSMGVGASVAAISLVIGLIIGLYSSYYKTADAILMRICDGLKAIPAILLAIALMAVLGASIKNVILALSIVYIPDIARITRSAALISKEQTYVEAMKSLGASSNRIIWYHILPNVLSPVIVQASFIFATAIVSEAALSFLGVGVPVPEPSWGNILYEAKTVIFEAWWMVLSTGIFTAAAVMGLNMLGDGIREIMDPMSN
jgi:peptide/nickel transport system permease protein